MKVELCAASIEAIKLAKELNFDRIELCMNLEQGGTTPSPGFIEYALAFGLETHVLIRPRSGGFYYSEDELEIIMRDIVECEAMGVKGVVIGALDEYGLVNEHALDTMLARTKNLDVTFHRAFDVCVDWEKGIELLIEKGVNRILTSGTARNAETGIPILQQMKKKADGKIELMVGGGVNAVNCIRIIDEVQPDAIHFSGTVKSIQDDTSLFSESTLHVDPNRVQRILDAINSTKA